MISTLVRGSIAVFLTASLAGPASAQDEGWAFDLAGYGWLLSMKGEILANGTTVDVDVPFSEVLDALNMGLFAKAEARYDRWFVALDFMGAVLESDMSIGPRSVGFGPKTATRGPLTVSVPRVTTSVGPVEVDVDTTMISLDLFGGYRVLTRSLGGDASGRKLALDVYAGGRYWYLKNEVDVFIPPVKVPGFTVGATLSPVRFPGKTLKLPGIDVPGVTLGGLDRSTSDSSWWIDPQIGLRVRADVTNKLAVTVLGDIGGFGIGSASDFAWEALAMLGWRINRSWMLGLGYRAIGLDRQSGGSGFDGTMHGPMIGVSYAWGAGHHTPLD